VRSDAPFSLRSAGIDVVLLDIEGTTTPISFVHDVLFPYARTRVGAYLAATAPADAEIQRIIEDLRAELAADALDADIVGYVHWLMDRDRKSGPLKSLQGRIWEEGYATGALRGEVYPDVREAFVRWTAGGCRVAIFSSGSVLAQRLLFEHSSAGDLSRLLSGYFDTAVGAKGEAGSYRRIAEGLKIPPSRVLFISDVVAELDAAREAGMQTRLCVRSPAPVPPSNTHGVVESFDAIVT
jgi:enolase-phosphatase E1